MVGTMGNSSRTISIRILITTPEFITVLVELRGFAPMAILEQWKFGIIAAKD